MLQTLSNIQDVLTLHASLFTSQQNTQHNNVVIRQATVLHTFNRMMDIVNQLHNIQSYSECCNCFIFLLIKSMLTHNHNCKQHLQAQNTNNQQQALSSVALHLNVTIIQVCSVELIFNSKISIFIFLIE